ncbi:MAG: hypothetical protein JRI87_07305 [Deltaproteobacteria bacterium]|nr:hypothetical protein [Deltaproteobacteria bacterium]
MPRGHRHMYYSTGLPGWMRFGYSPGWGGVPPGATYMMTGQWPTPQAQAYWQAMQSGQAPHPQYGPGAPSSYPGFQPSQEPMMNQEQELEMLKNQAQFLKQQMDYIDARIKEMEKES